MKWFCLACLLGLLACNQNPVTPTGPEVGSETHWLETCDRDADCGEPNACVCGICTAPCADAEACAAAGDNAICALRDSGQAAELCGALPAGGAGVCARSCTDAPCAADQICGDSGVCLPAVAEAPTPRLVTQEARSAPRQAVDFLFVVDDSGSMCQEQAALDEAFAAVVPMMRTLDYRIAIVSTDLQRQDHARFLADPTPPEPSLNCRDAEGRPWIPETDGCAQFLEQRSLPEIIGARETPDTEDLKRWFRCLANLGTAGDGFEKGLEAMRLGLSCAGPNRARFGGCCDGDDRFDAAGCAAAPPDFLRPDADLVVVVISDEDDCSAPADNSAASPLLICKGGTADANSDGIPDAFEAPACVGDPAACFAAECGELDPESCLAERCIVARSENSNCEWQRDTLVPVETYRDFLVTLKGDPAAVAVWAFVGPPAFTSSGHLIRFDAGMPEPVCDPDHPEHDGEAWPEECCPEGRCTGRTQTTCGSDLGESFAGHRYRQLAESLPFGCGPGEAQPGCSICANTLDLGAQVASLPRIALSHCLDVRPACVVVADGEFRPCVGAERAESANYTLRADVSCVAPACTGAPESALLTPEDWRLLPSEDCASGLIFAPEPGAVPAGADIRLSISP